MGMHAICMEHSICNITCRQYVIFQCFNAANYIRTETNVDIRYYRELSICFSFPCARRAPRVFECECQCVPPCLCACELVYASFSVFNQRRTARLGPISSDEPSTSKASVPVRYKGCLHTGSDRIPVGIAS